MAATVIGVKNGSSKGGFSLQMVRNLVITNTAFKLCYYVIADTTADDFATIAAATGIPPLGTRLYGAMCTAIEPGENTNVRHPVTGVSTILWEVEVTFDTLTGDPDNQNPEVTWEPEVGDAVLEYDTITGQRITTTADEPIFYKVEDFFQVLQIRRLEDYPFNDQIPLLYNGTLNATPFYGRPRGTGRMMGIRGEEDTIENERKVWVTYTIKFKVRWNYDGSLQEDTWKAHPLNIGYMRRPEVGADPIKNIDGRGNPIKCNLDGDGLKLVNGESNNLNLLSYSNGSLTLPAVYDLFTDYPVASDVGSTLIITGGPGWTVGSYPVVGVLEAPNSLSSLQAYWIIGSFDTESGNPVDSLPGDWPAANGAASGEWQIQRCPIYLSFNTGYYREFNGLSLGPF